MKTGGLVHPSYSYDLSACGFLVFGRAKTVLQNRRFVDSGDIVEALTSLFGSVTFNELHPLFQNWIRRLEWVIRKCGEHFTE
jgi:hypothetical protein